MAESVQVKGSHWDAQTLQETIAEQHELIQSTLRAIDRSGCKIRPGISPLNTEHVAISASSIDQLNSEQVAGWAVVWGNKRLSISGSCHRHTSYPDFYYEFMALKEAILTTPREQSITVVANTMILVNYMKHKRVIVKGKDVVGGEFQLLEPLIAEIECMIKGRAGEVVVTMINEDLSWLMQLRDSAAVIAHAEQRNLRWSMLNSANSSNTTDDISDTSTINSMYNDKNTQRKRKIPPLRDRRSAGSRLLLKTEVERKPQPIAAEAPTVQNADEHSSFIRVPRYKTSTSHSEKSTKDERRTLPMAFDRVGEGSCVSVFGTGGSGSILTTLANDSSQKRRTEHLVSVESETRKKQKAEPLSSDTDDSDVYEDAVECIYDGMDGATV